MPEIVSYNQQALRSGSPQDGVCAALHRQQRIQQANGRSTGFPRYLGAAPGLPREHREGVGMIVNRAITKIEDNPE